MIRHFCDCCERECPPYEPWSQTDDSLDHWVITMTPPLPHPDFYELNHDKQPGKPRTPKEAYFLTHELTATLDICGACSKRAGLSTLDVTAPRKPLWVERAPSLLIEIIKKRAQENAAGLGPFDGRR